MKTIIATFLLLLFCTNGKSQITRPIGTNLSGIVDYSSEFVFVDVMKQSREWIAHNVSGGPWDSGVNVPLSADGYPLEIPYDNGIDPPQALRTLLFFGNLEGIYPSGNYRLIASGTGQIQLFAGVSGTFNCPIDTVIPVNSLNGGVIIDIVASQAADPINDIRFVMPGHHTSYLTEPFHPDLLSFIEDFQVLRFMDWLSTNNSTNQNWNDRTTENYVRQTRNNGVAPEILIDLCNRTQKSPWICIPHRATNDYVVQFADLLKTTLDTNLTIYVEYSNEVWNGQFAQSQYNDSMGAVLGYPGQPWEQGWQYYAKRNADIFHLFDSVFVGSNQLKKVVASQAGNPYVSDQILTYFNNPIYNPSQVSADMLAIAPYFGGIADDFGNAGLAASCTVDQILDSMEVHMQESFEWMADTKVIAENHNVELVSYEGGQHLVAGFAYNSDTAFVNKLIAANRHSRMTDLYCDYFNFWYDSIGSNLFCQFSSHYIPNQYGSWGVKETYDDTLSPKYLGIQSCVFSYNSNAAIDEHQTNTFEEITIFPNPTNGVLNFSGNFGEVYSVTIYSLDGKVLKHEHFTPTVKVNELAAGIYVIQLQDINHQTLHTSRFMKQ